MRNSSISRMKNHGNVPHFAGVCSAPLWMRPCFNVAVFSRVFSVRHDARVILTDSCTNPQIHPAVVRHIHTENHIHSWVMYCRDIMSASISSHRFSWSMIEIHTDRSIRCEAEMSMSLLSSASLCHLIHYQPRRTTSSRSHVTPPSSPLWRHGQYAVHSLPAAGAAEFGRVYRAAWAVI